MEQGLFIVLITVLILLLVLFVIAEWRIMTKAGEKGWKSLVPFYSVFVSHHIAGMSHVWFILEIAALVIEVMFEIVKVPEALVFWFGIAAGAFTFVSELIHIIKLCDRFGKGTGFKIGMFFIPSLFLIILGFGKSEYIKPNHS